MRNLLLVTIFFMSGMAGATDAPPCVGSTGSLLPVNNDQVVQWKHSTKNEYHDRGHVTGKITQVYPDQTGHHHFQVQVAATSPDTIEIVYNEDFGPVPNLRAGDSVEACGDYITANQRAGGYPPSPDGALMHWVHKSDSPHHPSGYMIIDGIVTGQK